MARYDEQLDRIEGVMSDLIDITAQMRNDLRRDHETRTLDRTTIDRLTIESHIRELSGGRFVQVSILSNSRLFPRQWDTLDGTERNNLKVGDRVQFKPIGSMVPTRGHSGFAEGIVREVGRGQLDYYGPWSVATRID